MADLKITINPIEKCSMDCFYCHSQEVPLQKPLSFEECQKRIELIKSAVPNYDNLFIHFNSQDIFLCWDELVKPILEEYRNQATLSVHSNGLLLNEQRLQFLKDNGVKLMISIDGPKSVNDINRLSKNGKSVFTIVENNIKQAMIIGLRPNLIGTYNNKSILFMAQAVEYFLTFPLYFRFLFDIRYSSYDNIDYISEFRKVAEIFLRSSDEQKKQFRNFQEIYVMRAATYTFAINPKNISFASQKHSYIHVSEEELMKGINPAVLNRGFNCGHNSEKCPTCPAFNGIIEQKKIKPKRDLYCDLIQTLLEVQNEALG